MLGLSLVSMVAVLGIGMLNSSWFDVDSVTVVGAERADPDRIVTVSDIMVGQPLLDVDVEYALDQVHRVPWVGKASIRRDWRGDVVITVEERDPLLALPVSPAAANGGPGGEGPAPDGSGEIVTSGFVLVDYWGRQIDVAPAVPEGFLPVRGVAASGELGALAPPEAALAINFIEALPDRLGPEILALEVVDGDLVADLQVGGRANFGDSRDLGRKFQTLETVLARVDLSCLGMVDVRVPAAPALRRGDGSVVGEGSEAVEAGRTTC